MKIVKKLKILMCFFVILLMSYLLFDLISYSIIGIDIKPSHYILDILVLIYWIYLLKNTIKNNDEKSKTIDN